MNQMKYYYYDFKKKYIFTITLINLYINELKQFHFVNWNKVYRFHTHFINIVNFYFKQSFNGGEVYEMSSLRNSLTSLFVTFLIISF
jgi:hypothetical protein